MSAVSSCNGWGHACLGRRTGVSPHLSTNSIRAMVTVAALAHYPPPPPHTITPYTTPSLSSSHADADAILMLTLMLMMPPPRLVLLLPDGHSCLLRPGSDIALLFTSMYSFICPFYSLSLSLSVCLSVTFVICRHSLSVITVAGFVIICMCHRIVTVD